MSRTSLMISREIASALADDAQRQGKPLYYLANDIVTAYLKAREKGYKLQEVIDSYEALMFAKRMGHVLIPDDLLDLLLEKGYALKMEKFTPECKESGRKMGRYVESIYPNPLDGLMHIMPNVFWELTFDFRFGSDQGSIYITAPYQSRRRAVIASAFVEGFIEACGYSLKKNEMLHGLIKIEYEK